MDLAKIRKKHKKAPVKAGKAAPTEGPAEEPAPLASATVAMEAAIEVPSAPPEELEDYDMPRAVEPADVFLEFVVFDVGGERFAVAVDDVSEIVRDQVVTIVPRAERWVLGVTSLGGKIIPVIDPALRLGVSASKSATEQVKKKRKIVIVKGPKGPAGIVLRGAMDVIAMAPSMVLPTPQHVDSSGGKAFVASVLNSAGGFVSVISLEEFLDF